LSDWQTVAKHPLYFLVLGLISMIVCMSNPVFAQGTPNSAGPTPNKSTQAKKQKSANPKQVRTTVNRPKNVAGNQSAGLPSFATALGWMVTVGVHAETMGHHPEWFNVYNTVRVYLITHDIGNAISNLDVELAKKMEDLA